MKRFKDLEFEPHPLGLGSQARITFDNGYGVSVLLGESFYSDGVSSYELGGFGPGGLDEDLTCGWIPY